MKLKLAINGLGRIGRSALRIIAEEKPKNVEVVAINATMPAETYTTLLKYDSVHGKSPCDISAVDDNTLVIDGRKIPLFHERNPENIPWGTMNVDVVLECTGKFKDKESASKHIKAGARKVIISTASKEADATIVYGVNNADLKDEHKVISVASCTTNALAPLAKILHETFGIEHGYMTTIHAYTMDQNLLDSSHKDIRRARACALSMIPTSTGAAKAIGLVLPELQGKIAGSSIRVPVPNVSMIDFVFYTSKDVSKEEINAAIANAANTSMKGIVSVATRELVSIDFNHTSESTILDPYETSVVGKRLGRIVSWYDNEWGFTHRMVDVAELLHMFNMVGA